MDYQTLLTKASEIVIEAGHNLLPHFGQVEHETKSHSRDFVTKLDQQTEKFVAKKLLDLSPNIGFKGEEYGFHKKADTYWLCDPIDGTLQFIRGIPFCTTMLALVENDKPVIGIIYNFVSKELFTAIEGKGAYLNGQPITVSNRPVPEAVVVLESNQSLNRNVQLRAELRKRYYLMQLIVSGYEFGLIASGKIEGRICRDPYGSDHDYAPGALLVKEAGGVVTNIGKRTFRLSNCNFIAASPAVYKDLTEGENALLPISQ
jgi:myo-inositol-1(or 4)-monophosphatase